MNSKLKRKDHVYELSLNMELIKTKNSTSTSMYELILNFKNKLKTQVKQSKNSPKIYQKLLVINRAHGKKMTLRN